jgi:hypothetical protein
MSVKSTTSNLEATIRIVVACAVAAFMIFSFAEYYHKPPDVSSVNGKYVNPCCKDVYIENGVFSYGHDRTKFRIAYERLELHGYLYKPIGPFYIQTITGNKPTVIVFHDGQGFSVLDYTHKERSFARIDVVPRPSG